MAESVKRIFSDLPFIGQKIPHYTMYKLCILYRVFGTGDDYINS